MYMGGRAAVVLGVVDVFLFAPALLSYLVMHGMEL